MVTPLYCRTCGTRLPTDSAFCPRCGTSQTGADQELTVQPQPEPSLLGTGRQPVGHILHQRYRLLHTVGQGGMGAVYVAQDTQLGDRLVAVKEMSMSRLAPQDLPQAVEQFRREAHLLASLHHPNLPVIHEYFSADDRWYLVMSFVEGQNLQAALSAAPENRLPVNEVVRIGIELCEVLDYLIALGIVLAILLSSALRGSYGSVYDSCSYYDSSNNCVAGYDSLYYSSTPLYSMPSVVWIPSAIVGITAIIASFRKKRAESI